MAYEDEADAEARVAAREARVAARAGSGRRLARSITYLFVLTAGAYTRPLLSST
jgi:hypothetical protein